jgi:hypothetical protein
MTWLKIKHGTPKKQYNVITILAFLNMLSPKALSKTKQVIFNAPYLVLSYDELLLLATLHGFWYIVTLFKIYVNSFLFY